MNSRHEPVLIAVIDSETRESLSLQLAFLQPTGIVNDHVAPRQPMKTLQVLATHDVVWASGRLDFVEQVLRAGAERAGSVARQTLSKVRRAVGLRG